MLTRWMPDGRVPVLDARVKAVTVCLPVLRSSAAKAEPMRPVAWECTVSGAEER